MASDDRHFFICQDIACKIERVRYEPSQGEALAFNERNGEPLMALIYDGMNQRFCYFDIDTGHVSRASGNNVWLVYAIVLVVISQASSQSRP